MVGKKAMAKKRIKKGDMVYVKHEQDRLPHLVLRTGLYELAQGLTVTYREIMELTTEEQAENTEKHNKIKGFETKK